MNIINNSLYIDLKRSINMTFNKYKSKEFLSNNYYHETSNVNVNDIDITIINSIKNLAKIMPFEKVPGPIFVMSARKLEYDKFKYDNDKPCLEDIYINGNKSYCYNLHNNDYNFITNFVSLDDIKKSNLSKFTYKNNCEIHILYPNLSINLKYFTNYTSYAMTNEHIYNILTDPYLYQILNTQDNVDYFQAKRMLIEGLHLNPNYIGNINESINKLKKIQPGYNTSSYQSDNQILYEKGGCVCDYGEDLNNILNSPNSKYVPNKCLMKLSKDNISYNTDIDFGLNAIKTNLINTSNLGNIYKTTQNTNSEYNELNIRNTQYPGIQEIVFSAVQINYENNEINNYILNLPWGNILLCRYYIIIDNIYYYITPDDILMSSNGLYFLYFNSFGQIGIYKKNFVNDFIHIQLYYTLNNNQIIKDPINLGLSNNSLIINTINNTNNIIIPIGNNINSSNTPFAVVLDNDGYLRMYGDYFMDITSPDFIDMIDNAIANCPPNISSMIYQDNNGNLVSI